jgi:hypothetical protein
MGVGTPTDPLDNKRWRVRYVEIIYESTSVEGYFDGSVDIGACRRSRRLWR